MCRIFKLKKAECLDSPAKRKKSNSNNNDDNKTSYIPTILLAGSRKNTKKFKKS
jgi:hypothetical protein